MKSKVIFLVLLCLLLAFSSFGCGETIDFYKNVQNDTQDDDEKDEPDRTERPVPTPTVTAIPVQTPSPTTAQAEENFNGWTIMLYLNGSNLESDAGEATTNLISILSVPLPENVHIIIYTGGTREWQNDVISSEKNQIWEVDSGELVLLDSMDAASIGERSTLAGFLRYGQQLYPNTRRALLMWNHGAGSIAGFGVDELFNEDQLFLSEIDDAFASSFDGQKYDLVGFDACLMASVETAAILEPYAKYMVASEETEPGGGWGYEYMLGSLASDPSMNGLDFGIAITDGYYDKYSSTEWESMTTCSVVDLGLIPAVETALGNFASQLTTEIRNPQTLSTVASARQRSEKYGEAPESVPFDLVDLYNFVELQYDLSPALSDELMTAIENAVVYEVSGSQRIYSYGLSVYFPFSAVEYFPFCLEIYSDIGFCDNYHQFIADFAAQLSSQSYLSFIPDYDPELEETGEQDMDAEEPLYYVQLTNEEMEYMSYVYCALGWAVNDDVVIDLGFDSDVNIDFETNIISDDFDCSWTGLNGKLVSLYVMEETDEYVKYSIPVLYNGKKAIVTGSWIWDSYNAEGGYYKYTGIFYANEDFSAPNTKFTIEVKPGDKITPTFKTLFTDGYQGYYEGETFTVDSDGLYLELIWLPDGDYYYGFLFIDNYGEEHYTDYTPIEVWTE